MKLIIPFLCALFALNAQAKTPPIAVPETKILKCSGLFFGGSHPVDADITIAPGSYPSDRAITISISQSSPMPQDIDCKLKFSLSIQNEKYFSYEELNFVEASQCKSKALVGQDPELEESWEKTTPIIAWSFEFVGSRYTQNFEYEYLYKVKTTGSGTTNNLLTCLEVN